VGLDPGLRLLNFDLPALPTAPDDRQRPGPKRLSSPNWAARPANSASTRPRIPRRLDVLQGGRGAQPGAPIEQGAPSGPIRCGRKPNRLLRRLAIAQQVSGQSFLLGGGPGHRSTLPGLSSGRPALTAVPLVLGVPGGLTWLKLQGKLQTRGRIDKLPGVGGWHPAQSPQSPFCLSTTIAANRVLLPASRAVDLL